MKHRVRRLARAVGAAAVLGAALGGCERGTSAPPVVAGVPRKAGFVEEGRERGLDFRSHFLPTEQGQNFKINLYDHGSGVAVEDVDGDGDDDVYLLDQLGPNKLFRNDGGKFTDVTAAAGVAVPDRISVGAMFGDLDGDGDADLYVTTTRGGNLLFRNEGGMRFTDVTKQAGVELVAHSQSPLLFDPDGDGDLDILVTNTAKWTLAERDESNRYWTGVRTLDVMIASEIERNAFYRNEGGLRFTECAVETGLDGEGWDGDAAPFDYDEDGDVDVFMANMFGRSRLLRNRGNGTFEDVTRATLGAPPWGAIGSRVLDADGDGRLDLYVADMHSDMWVGFRDAQVVQEKRRFDSPDGRSLELGRISEAGRRKTLEQLRVPDVPLVYGTALFRNTGGGRFEDITAKSGADTWWPWGVAVGDFDVDGDEDVFLPSGMGYPWFYWRSSLLLNHGDATFEERGRDHGIEPLPDGPYQFEELGQASRSFRCAAIGDFDADGRPDIVTNAFNGRAMLWMNRFPARRWIGLRLAGTKGAREAIGAFATIRAGGKAQVRMVQPTGGYLSQSTRTLYFGIGDAASVEVADIRWPGGMRQTLTNLAGNTVHLITEPRE